MRIDDKFLGCLISLALGAGPLSTQALAKPNKKPLILSENMAAKGNGRRIAGDGKGSFLAVWVDADTAEIHGRYLSGGSAGGNPFKIGAFDAESGIDPQVSVAMNPDGDAVVCWADASDLDGNYYTPLNLKVFCRRVEKATQANVATPVLMVNAVNNKADAADALFLAGVAMDAGGDFIVAWQDFGKNRKPVMARRYTRGGVAKGNAIEVAADSHAFAYSPASPSVAVDQDGDAVVVWAEGIDYYDPGNAIYARRIDKDGKLPKPKFRVDLTTPADEADYGDDDKALFYAVMSPVAAMDEAGNFAVAWLRQRRDSTRAPACGEGFVCFSYDAEASSTLYLQRFDQNDNPLQLNKKTSTPEEFAVDNKAGKQYLLPAIAMDGSGDFVVAWQEKLSEQQCYEDYCYDVSLGDQIFSRKFSRKKNKFAAIKKIAKPTKINKDNESPSVAMSADGSFAVLWSQGDYDYGNWSATARLFSSKRKN